MDVVGYSKLLVDEQRDVVHELNEVVRQTARFRKSSLHGELICIPSGDGMALVFFQTPEEPVQCALEIASALKDHPRLRLRMGVHSGPVDQIKDVNDRLNVAGAGINIAQRVMDCGDAGHILVSKRIADDLAEDRLWQPLLHELGEIELKHNMKLEVVNLYSAELGNPHRPQKFFRRAAPVREALADKSIAVLPFENLSANPENAFFVDGVHDEILIDLAGIADLKVISRTSVMQYKTGAKRNLREIATELNVAHIVEGSVQRAGNRVRVRAQLIDARSDSHLWADRYDRPLDDVFAIQSEIAKAIADQLKAKLSPAEKAALERPPTTNLLAFDHYARGKFYLHRQTKEGNEQAISSLEQAIAADPRFAAAHAELAQAYLWKLFLFAPNETRWAEKAFVEAEKALELDPNLAAAHLARGCTLWTPANHFPHEAAIRAYRRALELNPTLDEARSQLAVVYCHIGALDEALRESRNAVATDPTNYLAQYRIGETLNFQCKNEQALLALRAIPKDANPALVENQIVWALYNLGRKEEAAATAERYLKDYPEDYGGLFASLQAILAAAEGDQQLAEEKIHLAVERGKGFGHFHHTAYHIGCAYALMNKPEQAIDFLQFAAEDGFPCYPLFAKDRNLDVLRDDARFAALLSKLEQQWKHYRSVL
jgi:adenylate cyclase